MPFDRDAYANDLLKSIQESYTLHEVDPNDIGQADLGAPAPSGQQTPQASSTPNAPMAGGTPHAKDPEISMEVLKGTVQWALGEKDAGKSTEEVINQLGAMKKPGLIDFIHSYLQGSGQQAPTSDASVATDQNQPTPTGEPAADDLSGLTNPEPQQDGGEAPPTDNPEDAGAGIDDLKL
jgi:hypothetical protein